MSGQILAFDETNVCFQSAEQHLVDANTIYRVQANGFVVQLTQEQVDAELEELARNHRAGVVPSAETIANSVASVEPPAVVPATGDDADNQREVTSKKYSSFSIYKYFLQPAGIVAVIIWLVLNGFASASERMPSKPSLVRFLDTQGFANTYRRLYPDMV